jgi:hypothetical protein
MGAMLAVVMLCSLIEGGVVGVCEFRCREVLSLRGGFARE